MPWGKLLRFSLKADYDSRQPMRAAKISNEINICMYDTEPYYFV